MLIQPPKRDVLHQCPRTNRRNPLTTGPPTLPFGSWGQKTFSRAIRVHGVFGGGDAIARHAIPRCPGTAWLWQDVATYLSAQARRAVEKYGAENVVVASLTRAAAEEVAGRDTGIPSKNVSTLHAHAYRALEHPEVADVPEGFADWNRFVGAGPLQIRTGLSVDLEGMPAEAFSYMSDGEVLLNEYGIERNRMTDRETWRPRLREFAERWETWKQKTGRMDFTDLIEQALRTVPRLPNDPAVFMLDEAQDLSKLEMALARKWGEQTEHFVVVGDQDQAIFSWRGADPEAFISGETASQHVLSQSYRVPRAVHEYAVNWIERIETREPVAYEPRDFDGDVQLARSTWTRPEALIAQAVQKTEEGKSVAFLATCAFMLEPLIRILREKGVPFHNPLRPTQGAWNPMRSAYRVLAFLRPDSDAWGAEARDWDWSDLRAWTEPLIARGVMTRGSKSLIESKLIEDKFGDSEAEALVSASQAFSLFEPEHHSAILDLNLEWWESKLRAKKKQTYAYPLEIVRRRGVKALKEEPKISVGTFHSYKGGEVDCAIVFPDISRRAAEEIRKPGGREAAIRLFYVAFTRAREGLYICRPDAAHYLVLPDP